MAKTYFVATKHETYKTHEFEPDATVIDPWRYVPSTAASKVRRLGENKPALISVLVPSRGRPDSFARMYRSLVATAVYPRQIEVVARLDLDDLSKSEYPWENGVRLTYLPGERTLLSSCWNECYQEASGDILMHCGDDVTFNTPGWDQRVRDEFAKIPDRIGLVYGDDLSTNFPDLATHGFMHRRWVETVGYFLPPLFSSDWNDVWISDVAKRVKRMVPIPDVVIEHHHYTFGKAERDKTHAEREERGARDGVVELYKRTEKNRKQDAAKLKAVMA